MFRNQLRIRNPYAFRSSEREAAQQAIYASLGLSVTAWYTNWEKDDTGRIEEATDFLTFAYPLTKTQRKEVGQTVLTLMRYHIRMHFDPKSFREPEVLPLED